MRLKFWINAFIPRDVSNYTQEITKGTHQGKTAVPLPGVARLHPLNMFKNGNAGYLTDQRDFSSSEKASCRMQSLMEISLFRVPKVLSSSHTSSGTTEVDMKSGEEIAYKVADMSRCSFTPLTEHRLLNGNQEYRVPYGRNDRTHHPGFLRMPPTVYRTRVTGAAGDPLVSAAADIDYNGVFEISPDPDRPSKCMVSFEGKIDDFPAFECYAALNGNVKILFKSPPPSGNTVTDLLGGANRVVKGHALF